MLILNSVFHSPEIRTLITAILVPYVFDALQLYEPPASNEVLFKLNVLFPLTAESELITILGLEAASITVSLKAHAIFGGGEPTKLHLRIKTSPIVTVVGLDPSICMAGTTINYTYIL